MYSPAGKVLPISCETGKGTALIHGTNNIRAPRLKSRLVPGSASTAGMVGLKVYLFGLVETSFARAVHMQHFLSVCREVRIRTLSLFGYRQREAEEVCVILKGMKLRGT
jgi:hypothetical protein